MKAELLKNIKTFLNSAEMVYKIKDYTSATVLYFKTAFAVIDFIILDISGKAPKDHEERFKLAKELFPDAYKFLDETFSVYRKTYKTTIDKASCDMVINDVKKIIKKYSIPV